MASASAVSTFDIKSFLSLLTCPVNLTPLRDGVNLFPCCHKVSQVAAEILYGKIVGNFCELRERKCVICQIEVVAYTSDHTIRDLAIRAFGPEADLSVLPDHSLVLEEKREAIADLLYPGLSAVSTFDIKSFLSLLTCPVNLTPLRDGVNLFPCCHKVSQVAAEILYGKIVGNFCELREKKCVICQIEVVAYASDHTIRDLAIRAFGPEADLSVLPDHSLVLEEKREAIADLPYPGLSAVFDHYKGDWDEITDRGGSDLRRYIEFRSITKDSFLKTFSILGYSNGSVSIFIKSQGNKGKELQKYLLAYRMVMDDMDTLMEFYKTKTHADLKLLFGIVARNNQIPEEHFTQIKEIVESGRCASITLYPREHWMDSPSGTLVDGFSF